MSNLFCWIVGAIMGGAIGCTLATVAEAPPMEVTSQSNGSTSDCPASWGGTMDAGTWQAHPSE